MTPEQMRDRAVDVFSREKMLCSQAVVTAGLEFIGEDEPNSAIRAARGICGRQWVLRRHV